MSGPDPLDDLLARMRAAAFREDDGIGAEKLFRRAHMTSFEARLEACFDGADESVTLRPADLKPGQLFSKWIIDAPLVELSSGKPSLLFKAHNPTDDREQVVIKVMMPKTAHIALASRRFRKEQAVSAAVKHNNIAECLETGEMKGVPYIVTRLYAQSLAEIDFVDTKKLLEVGLQVAEGLKYLRDVHGMVHGDLKPDNILLDESGAANVVAKINDFGGTVKITDNERDDEEHTPAYTRPYRDSAQLKQRYYSDDIYALVLALMQKLYGTEISSALNLIDPDFNTLPTLIKHQKALNRLAIQLVVSKTKVPKNLRWAFVRALTYNREKSISLEELIDELKRAVKTSEE